MEKLNSRGHLQLLKKKDAQIVDVICEKLKDISAGVSYEFSLMNYLFILFAKKTWF